MNQCLQGQAGKYETVRKARWGQGQAVILSGPSPLWNHLSVSQEKQKKRKKENKQTKKSHSLFEMLWFLKYDKFNSHF